MEFRKYILRVLSIGLMLSIFSPMQAADQKRPRGLYWKCIARKCNDAEKAQVRVDLKKAGKRAGALLIAAAVAIGAAMLLKQFSTSQKENALIEAALGWVGIELGKIGAPQKRYLELFAKASVKGAMDDRQLKAELKKKGANPQGDACIEVAAAYIYYYNTNQGFPRNMQIVEFRAKQFPQAGGGVAVTRKCPIDQEEAVPVVPKGEVRAPGKAEEAQKAVAEAFQALRETTQFVNDRYQSALDAIKFLAARPLNYDQEMKIRQGELTTQLNGVREAMLSADSSWRQVLQKARGYNKAKAENPENAKTALTNALQEAKQRMASVNALLQSYEKDEDEAYKLRKTKKRGLKGMDPLQPFEFTPEQKAKIDYLEGKSGNAFVWYEVLNVAPNTTDREITSAYRKLAVKYHPDKNPASEKEIYTEIFKIIGNAKDIAPDEKQKGSGQRRADEPAPKRQRLTY